MTGWSDSARGHTPNRPWYPQARIFTPKGFGQWEIIMGEVAGALAQTYS